MKDSDCKGKQADYIKYTDSLTEATDKLQNTANLSINYDLPAQKQAYADCAAENEKRLAEEKGKQEGDQKAQKQQAENPVVNNAPITPAPKDRETPPPVSGTTSVPAGDDLCKNSDKAKECDLCAKSGGDWNDVGKNCDCDPKGSGDKYYDPETKSCKSISDLQSVEEISAADANATGRCPATGNALKSITDKTKVGDPCSSSIIVSGEVFMRKSGVCSCAPTKCVTGYHIAKGGGCAQDTADAAGMCLRKAFPATPENNTTAKCSGFCAAQAEKNKCKTTTIVMRHSTKECICNADQAEISAAQTSMQAVADNKIANLKFFAVCGNDKGKSGGTERCVSDVFNWVTLDLNSAIAIAQEYARVKYGDTVECSPKYETRGKVMGMAGDDFVKCSSTAGNIFYEFQFDSTATGFDNSMKYGVQDSVCQKIHGVKSVHDGCANNSSSTGGSTNWQCWPATCGADAATCAKISQSFQRVSRFSANFADGQCKVDFGEAHDAAELKTAFGINNKVFSRDIQTRCTPDTIDIIRRYLNVSLQRQNIALASFSCKKVTSTLYTGNLMNPKDDIVSCMVNSQQIDFLFDDCRELAGNYRAGAQSGLQCIDGGGLYDGKKCWGIDRAQCNQIENTEWNTSLNACLLKNAAAIYTQQKIIKTTTLIGITGVGCVSAVMTGGATTGACILAAVEVAGVVGEAVTDAKMQNWSDQFFAASSACQKSACADATIRDNIARVVAAKDKLPDAAAMNVDNEIARLAKLLPQDVQDKIFGGDPDKDAWEQALEYYNAKLTAGEKIVTYGHTVSIVAQFASAFAGGYTFLRNAPEMFQNMKNAWKAARAGNFRALGMGERAAGRAATEGAEGAAGRAASESAEGAAGRAAGKEAGNAGRGATNEGAGGAGNATGGNTGRSAGENASSGAAGGMGRNASATYDAEMLRGGAGFERNFTDALSRNEEIFVSRYNMTSQEVRQMNQIATDNGFVLDVNGGGNGFRFVTKEKYAREAIARATAARRAADDAARDAAAARGTADEQRLSNRARSLADDANAEEARARAAAARANIKYEPPAGGASGAAGESRAQSAAASAQGNAAQAQRAPEPKPSPEPNAARPNDAGRAIGATAADDAAKLRARASPDFETYLSDYKARGNNVGFDKRSMSAAEWELLNKDLARDNVKMVEYTDDGGLARMKFGRIADEPSAPVAPTKPNQPQTPIRDAGPQEPVRSPAGTPGAASGSRNQTTNINGYEFYRNSNFGHNYKLVSSEAEAQNLARSLSENGQLAGYRKVGDLTGPGSWEVIVANNTDELARLRQVYPNLSLPVSRPFNVSSPEELDQKFFNAYQKYAPKNQTLDEFREMLDNDEANLDNMVKDWDSNTTATFGEYNSKLWDSIFTAEDNAVILVKRYYPNDPDMVSMMNDYLAKGNVDAADTVKFTQMLADHPDIAAAKNSVDSLKQSFFASEGSFKAAQSRRYSTFDPAIARDKLLYKANVAAIDQDYQPVLHANIKYRTLVKKYYGDNGQDAVSDVLYLERPDSGALTFVESINDQHPDLAEAYNNIIAKRAEFANKYGTYGDITAKRQLSGDYIRKADNLSPDVLSKLAAERIDEFKLVIDGDPQLSQWARDFEALSNEQKTEFGQRLINRASDSNLNSEGYTLRVITKDQLPKGEELTDGWHDAIHKKIVIVSDNKSDSLDKFMDTLAHEDAHKIDAVNPNMGAVGAQRADFGKKIYQSYPWVPEDVYRQNWTEQSSYFIGHAVGNAMK
ncbi:MAG: hypothetical protein FWC61_00590 [Proteobacteria bacterium]|nr:hypothetical protein [Pseudomonadota bacterium]